MILRRSYREFHSLFIKNKAKLRDRNAAVLQRHGPFLFNITVSQMYQFLSAPYQM